jgi:hypothetical protein
VANACFRPTPGTRLRYNCRERPYYLPPHRFARQPIAGTVISRRTPISEKRAFPWADRPSRNAWNSWPNQELGARYILEGSVQRSANRVRITAQLIDGHTVGHLWSERYDRQLEDIFAVQDEVTETIVSTLASGWGGRLRKAWQGRAERKGTDNFQAFDCFPRGLDSFNFTKGDAQSSGKFTKRPNSVIAVSRVVLFYTVTKECFNNSWNLG